MRLEGKRTMTTSRAITNKGIVIFKDYELLFNFLTDEETGIVLKKLLQNFDNGKLKKCKNFENEKIKNVYNYISNRINDYLEKRLKAQEDGALGGNPILKGEDKDTLKGKDKRWDKLKEDKNNKKENIRKESIYILNHLNSKTKKNFKEIDSNLKLIADRLKVYTIEELTQMIDYMVKKWENTDFKQYLRPSTLFRASKCDNYVQESKSSINPEVEYIRQLEAKNV